MTQERPLLEEMTLRQLRRVASEYNISRYSRMRKSQLLASIEQAIQENNQNKTFLTNTTHSQEEKAVEASKFELGQDDKFGGPFTSVDENLGYLPGEIKNKMHPFLIPIYDYFLDYYTNDEITCLINSNKLEISPLAFMRGRTFSDSIVIADEMQNSSINQIKTLLTRIGSNKKIILTGDLLQTYIEGINGMENLCELLTRKYPEYYKMLLDGFAYVNLDKTCIERSEIISKIISLYDE
jgi:hypothetical protein